MGIKDGLGSLIDFWIIVGSYSFTIGARVARLGPWIGGGLTWEYGMNRGCTSSWNLDFMFENDDIFDGFELKENLCTKLSPGKDCFREEAGLLSTRLGKKSVSCCWARFCWEGLGTENPDQSGNWNCWLKVVGVLGSQENTSMIWKWW